VAGQNAEIARAAWEALDRGDVDVLAEMAAPGAEIDQTRAIGTDRGVYTVPEFVRLTQRFIENWESVHWSADEFIEGGDHVVMPFTNRLRGRDGIEVEARGVILWTIQGGLVSQATLYQDKAEALEAAGLGRSSP
jgi:ketosteroid isomerase-like protein